jgi:MFS family permease
MATPRDLDAEPGRAASRPRPQNPWYLAPWFGRTGVLEPATLRLLGLVSLGLLFENYDMGLVNAALPQIAGTLGMTAGETGLYMGAIRLGGLATFLIVPFADVIGRRRVFLGALVGMSVGTLGTALSQSPLQFTLCQMLTRAFLMAASVLAMVILVEEFPAHQRGAGLGLLSVLGGLGFGLVSGLYAAVDWLPFGWRALYALGILPVLLLPFFRRSLHETARFERESARRPPGRAAFRSWLGPIALLVRTHPGRAALVGGAGFFASLGSIGFFVYTSYFVQNAFGWAPGHYTLLVLGGGLIGLAGNLIGGRGSDRFGRRPVGFVCLALAPLFAALFYLGPLRSMTPSWTLVPAWGLWVLCTSAGDLVIRALAAELFDTSHRGTAVAWLVFVETLGWTLGLFAVALVDSLEGLAWIVSGLSLALAVAGILLARVPETGRRELESLSQVEPR